MALPGLEMNDPTLPPDDEAEPTIRIQTLHPQQEYRFQASLTRNLTIKLTSGTAEYFGTELAPNAVYTFRGAKGAVFSWQGATLEVAGDPEADSIAGDTPLSQYANVHFGLEKMRNGMRSGELGPRVLVVGDSDTGKTSLTKTLMAYALKQSRQCCLVNLNSESGVLAPPGSLSATSFGSILDIEEGWGSSPISGPSTLPVKMPLVYQFGCRRPQDQKALFKALVSRMAAAVTNRMGGDADVGRGGCFIDTPGSLVDDQNKSNDKPSPDLISHIISEFSINVILVLGSLTLHSMLKTQFNSKSPGEEPIAIIHLDSSPGCVRREEPYMKSFRQAQIREYFFGRSATTLSPYSQFVDFKEISIYKINSSAAPESTTTADPSASDDDEDYDPSTSLTPFQITPPTTIYTKVDPTMALQNCLLAITHANANDSLDVVRDSSVMGFIYVADVDEVKRKVKLLGPVGGRIPSKAMVWGEWPEDMLDLIG